MPNMSWYEIKVTGLLGGPKADHALAITEFLNLFPAGAPTAPEPPDPADPNDPESTMNMHASWPRGFMLPGYWAPIWVVAVEELTAGPITLAYGFPQVTHFTFQCQVASIKDGSLFTCKDPSIKEVKWFYNYCNCKWFTDLKAAMLALNKTLDPQRVLSPLDVRDWKWYCGNGAGD